MVERFNGRIAQVLKTTHFKTARQLHFTLKNYVHAYNNIRRLRALKYQTPQQVLDEYLKDNHNLSSPDI